MSVYAAAPKFDTINLPRELPATATGRKRWTREECQFLENSGRLTSRYELLDGEVILKVGQNRRHALCLSLIFAYLVSFFGPRRIQTQATMEVWEGDRIVNRPEPDLILLRVPVESTPQGTDVLLAIEVSDTTQGDDFGFKTRLYARAGVAEYWVLDVPRRVLVSFRSPDGDEWEYRTEYTESDTIAPFAAPDSTIRVGELLP